MKLPKAWTKWNNDEQRAWVASKLAETRQLENDLVKLLRLLVRDGKFIPKVDDRPDLTNLKDE